MGSSAWGGAQHAENPFQTVGVDYVTDAYQIEVAGRHSYHQIVLAHDAQH